jgi:hypothetical protein
MVDRETRLDATMPGPGNRITYLYTLVNLVVEHIDSAKFIATVKPILVNGYKNDPDLEELRKRKVDFYYKYRDKNGAVVAVILVSPKEF